MKNQENSSNALVSAASRGVSGSGVASSLATELIQSQQKKNEATSKVNAQVETSLLNDENTRINSKSQINKIQDQKITDNSLSAALETQNQQFDQFNQKAESNDLQNQYDSFESYIKSKLKFN